MGKPSFVPLPPRFDPGTTPEQAAQGFYKTMSSRRTVRMFADTAVSLETIEWLVRTACSAPSGANKQPWRFVCVQDPALKREIRLGAEEEERSFYYRRANSKWLEDLAPLGTDEHKDFLEIAPWLIVVFKLAHGDDGSQVYYTDESVGLACGLLLAAAHTAGLATVTHTPSPMRFLCSILDRPDNERPFLLIPVGYPSDDCVVPEAAIVRKQLEQSMIVR
ncbi:MAG: nitroreductase family protein [Planctomycetes bacterium]|jgi:nitroreductase|nr:nitroreductase family protein [Planctomycetota bacterium]MDP6424295.1 nitroreductase family protein [Planctomycetota bacterium]